MNALKNALYFALILSLGVSVGFTAATHMFVTNQTYDVVDVSEGKIWVIDYDVSYDDCQSYVPSGYYCVAHEYRQP